MKCAAQAVMSVLAAGILVGCHIATTGPAVAKLAPANSPHGISATLVLGRGQRLDGELLLVRESDMLLLDHDGIVRVPYTAVTAAEFAPFRDLRLRSGEAPAGTKLERLRALSRYPPGLTDEQLQRLLARHGQNSARELESPSGGEHARGYSPTSDLAWALRDTAWFLDEVRAGVQRYRDRDAAIADGYRRVGPDFPGMGEHWVQPGLLVAGRIDPRQPPILIYTVGRSGTMLVGVAFALPLDASLPAPDYPSPGAWHDHAASVDEESLLLNPSPAHGEAAGSGPRLAMLHAWLSVANPAGRFAQYNWSLPFSRLGLSAPASPSPQAARALFLASGGSEYYSALVRAAADERDDAALDAALASASADVDSIVRAHAVGGGLQASELKALEAIWGDLGRSLQDAVGPGARMTLARLLAVPSTRGPEP